MSKRSWGGENSSTQKVGKNRRKVNYPLTDAKKKKKKKKKTSLEKFYFSILFLVDSIKKSKTKFLRPHIHIVEVQQQINLGDPKTSRNFWKKKKKQSPVVFFYLPSRIIDSGMVRKKFFSSKVPSTKKWEKKIETHTSFWFLVLEINNREFKLFCHKTCVDFPTG